MSDSTLTGKLHDKLTYEPTTGVFTRNRDGYEYAAVGSHGYLTICFQGVACLAHDLAWLYMTGEWPEFMIDHRDGDKMNNRWDNYRPTDKSTNAMNAKTRSDNTSGVKGVWYEDSRDKWVVELRANGKRAFFQRCDTFEEASELVHIMREKLHGEFARDS